MPGLNEGFRAVFANREYLQPQSFRDQSIRRGSPERNADCRQEHGSGAELPIPVYVVPDLECTVASHVIPHIMLVGTGLL